MEHLLSRRQLLGALPLGLLFGLGRAHGLEDGRSAVTYQLDLSVLFSFLTLSLAGTAVQEIDRRAGRYKVTMERQRAEIHAVTHTLLLGRRRQIDDVLTIPAGRHVDDLISAELNFADNTLDRDPDGTYHTWVVRRARADNEGPDDVSPDGYRAELVPLRFRPSPDPATGGLTALIDITRFSSWARPDQPARVTFASDRQLTSVQSVLLYGSTLKLRVTGTA